MAHRFDVVVELLQSVLAALLVALLALGVFDIALIVFQPFFNGNVTKTGEITSIITSSVDTILYLLIVVELYHTIIAYVEDRDVIRAVVHAGLIAVARKIITRRVPEHGRAPERGGVVRAAPPRVLRGLLRPPPDRTPGGPRGRVVTQIRI